MQCNAIKCQYNSWYGVRQKDSEYTCDTRKEKVFSAVESRQYGDIKTDHNGFPILVCKTFKARIK